MEFEKLLLAVGALTSLYLLLWACSNLYTFLRPSSLPKYLNKSKGTYALVTGSTEGIGTAFARELCKHGFNVVLHGRNPTKLSRLQATLQHEFPSRTIRTFVFDASLPTADSLDAAIVRDHLNDIPLSILINNVGGTHGQTSSPYLRLQDHTNDEVDRVINVNARFMTQLTRALFPILARNGPALVINVSSVTSVGIPYLSVYAGTKAYVEAFTKAFAMEMEAEGIDIEAMCIISASVRTTGNPVASGLFIATPEALARVALARVGCGSASIAPYLLHWLQKLTLDYLPARLMHRLVIYNILLEKDKYEREMKRAT
ncbi:hypothetical protein FQN53_007642 [Emmonsiellopsis sp. PD_33]|nr:hypothetical protein FQN53_007642 [Emmonsiellopsis sp. PD_33]